MNLNGAVPYFPISLKSEFVSDLTCSTRSYQFGDMERPQRIDVLDRLSFPVPFEELQRNLVRREIHKCKAVLLDWFHVFDHVEVGRRQCAGATPARRPAQRAGAAANGAGEHCGDWIGSKVELAAA